jgi:predicted subunit of tRNA(5-methylaminomethyl-2-thiouridylate) methyltransferase
MKAGVLYSGGKDSSLMAVILTRLGYDVDLITINFGVYKSYIPAAKSANSLNLNHIVFNMDKCVLEEAVKIIMDDGFPNEGIKYLHEEVIESVAKKYDIIADGTRRDDRTPKLNKDQIRSLEDRHNVQYVNLDSFGYKMINSLVSKLFELSYEKSNKDTSSDYEVEIRLLIDQKGGNSSEIFPEHYQTNVCGFKQNIKLN